MKNIVAFSVIILSIVMGPSKSVLAQHVIVTRATVLVPPTPGLTDHYTGYWKWSPRYQKYIWVIKPKARFRIHRGYRVRI